MCHHLERRPARLPSQEHTLEGSGSRTACSQSVKCGWALSSGAILGGVSVQ